MLVLYLVNEDIRAGKVNLNDICLEDLIKIMAILSANDAAVAIAEHLAGSVDKFVARMNAKAKEVGIK